MRLTNISGLVFFDAILAMLALRLSGLSLSTKERSLLGNGYSEIHSGAIEVNIPAGRSHSTPSQRLRPKSLEQRDGGKAIK